MGNISWALRALLGPLWDRVQAFTDRATYDDWADQVPLYRTRTAHSEALVVRGTGVMMSTVSHTAFTDRTIYDDWADQFLAGLRCAGPRPRRRSERLKKGPLTTSRQYSVCSWCNIMLCTVVPIGGDITVCTVGTTLRCVQSCL